MIDNNDDQQSNELDALKAEVASQSERANRYEAKLKEHLVESGLERAAVRGRAFNPGCHRAIQIPPLVGGMQQPGLMIAGTSTIGKRW